MINEWEKVGFSSIRVKWLKGCYKFQQEIEVDGVKGIFENLDKDGTLVMKLQDGTYNYVKSGDVFWRLNFSGLKNTFLPSIIRTPCWQAFHNTTSI